MNFILFDDKHRNRLLPLTFTRPVAELRVGILTIREKWQDYLKASCSTWTQDYLQAKYPLTIESDNLFINGGLCPNEDLLKSIESLESGQALVKDGILLAARLDHAGAAEFELFADHYDQVNYERDILHIAAPWDIFSKNGAAIEADFSRLTAGRRSQALSSTNTLLGEERIFAEEGAVAECAILNAKSGPIYLGKGSEVMEGSVVRGALALCDHAALKLSAKVYGPSTVGPHSKVGGELNNSVIIGYSNKGHDGFLGNSVIGEWCNLGADTNNSNLKNNYAEVKVWSYENDRFAKTGLQFCGLIMGDHSKSGINTMFNTGTVVGVSANIFGAGFPRNFIPSFSWGGASGFDTFGISKAFEVAERMMERRKIEFDQTEKDIIQAVFDQTAEYRYWEKQKTRTV